jgi:hypothetical protein
MAIVRLSDRRDRLAGLIDEALESYTAAAPQWGLERRTLRVVLGDSTVSGRRFPKWAWAIPALLAGFVFGVMLGRPVRAAFGAALNLSTLGEWCVQLQATWFSTSIRESLLLFPYLDGVHLLGLAIMLGPSMMLDLRLIGVLWKRDPVSKVASRFLPITLAGFVLVISAGILLFISEPVKCYESGYFRLKMGLIVLAAMNAFVFHATIDRRRSEWDTLMPPPAQARLAGILGLVLWTGVIFAGRYMAYNLSR